MRIKIKKKRFHFCLNIKLIIVCRLDTNYGIVTITLFHTYKLNYVLLFLLRIELDTKTVEIVATISRWVWVNKCNYKQPNDWE